MSLLWTVALSQLHCQLLYRFFYCVDFPDFKLYNETEMRILKEGDLFVCFYYLLNLAGRQSHMQLQCRSDFIKSCKIQEQLALLGKFM